MSNKNNLKKLNKNERINYKELGMGIGAGFGMCMFEGWKHIENFLQRVVAYYIEENNEAVQAMQKVLPNEKYLAVTFYENKK